jgi:Tfp pilus assembly protein PilO
MNPVSPDPDKTDFKSGLLKRLHDPLQLRICVTGIVWLLGYFLVYMPLDNRAAETTRQLGRQQKLLDLARDIEHLRTQHQAFEERLPKQGDSKEWVEYVLNGLRKLPLRLSGLDCEAPRSMGPYKAVVLRIELEGSFPDMDLFLRWLDSNERLFRTDAMRVAPSRSDPNVLIMQLTILGVMD